MQGLTLDGITSQRGVQLGTIQSYIAEAMAAGYPYPWHRLGVPHALLATFCSQLTAFSKHKQQQDEIWLQHQQQQLQADPQAKPKQEIKLHVVPAQAQQQPEAPSGLQQLQPQIQNYNATSQHTGCAVQQERQAHGHIVCHQLQQQMPQHMSRVDAQQLSAVTQTAEQQSGTGVLSVASQENVDLAPAQQQHAPQLWLQLDGTVTQRPSEVQAGLQDIEPVGQLAVKLPDQSLVSDLVKTGQGIKPLRDYIGPDVMAYGQMRIALAHLYRLSSQ